MRKDILRLELVVIGLVSGAAAGLLFGLLANWLLSSAGAHIDYVIFLKGNPLLSTARIFAGNLMLILLMHFLPERMKTHPEVPAVLIGTVGFVLGLFAATSGISSAEYARRLPHTVLEVFAYVVAARGGRLWPAILAVAAGAAVEWALVLK